MDHKNCCLIRLLALFTCLLAVASLATACMENETKPDGKPSEKTSEKASGKVSDRTSEILSDFASESSPDSPNTVRPDGVEVPMTLWSEEKPFEYWEKDGVPYYQLCVVIRKDDLDATEGMGSEDYRFTYHLWYRKKGSEEKLQNLDTPVETCYDLGDSVIYRLQTYPMMKDLREGEEYAITLEIEEGGNARVWGNLTVPFTEGSRADLEKYEKTLQDVK